MSLMWGILNSNLEVIKDNKTAIKNYQEDKVEEVLLENKRRVKLDAK